MPSVEFEELFRATYPKVLGYARAMAGSADADDAVAETFATAWRRQADIPAGAELGWLIGVTRRTLANRRRGERRLGALRTRLASQPAVAGPDPAAVAVGDEMRDALSALSPADREAVVLVAWFDLSPSEAAVALDIAPAAFRMRLARARRRLRIALETTPQEVPQWHVS